VRVCAPVGGWEEGGRRDSTRQRKSISVQLIKKPGKYVFFFVHVKQYGAYVPHFTKLTLANLLLEGHGL
jgi:hypothetical protein